MRTRSYSSHNLVRWRYEGIALHSRDVRGLNGEPSPGWILERPKCIYNPSTGLYVLWAHLDGPAVRPALPTLPTWSNYQLGAAAVAVSRTPVGPFTFVHAVRPPGGMRSFDASLFLDARRGVAYRVQDVEHQSIGFYELDGAFTNFSGKAPVAVLNERREAVAPFYWDGRYYLATSGVSGWAPTASKLYSRGDLLSAGGWESSNPFPKGPARGTSFWSQSAHVLVYDAIATAGSGGGGGGGGGAGGGRSVRQQALWMADRWCGAPPHRCKSDWCPCLLNASYLWLPLSRTAAKVSVQWCGEGWKPAPPMWSPRPAAVTVGRSVVTAAVT